MFNSRKYKVTFKIDREVTRVESDAPEVTIKSAYQFLVRKYGTKRIALYHSIEKEGDDYFRTPPALYLDGKLISNVSRIR